MPLEISMVGIADSAKAMAPQPAPKLVHSAGNEKFVFDLPKPATVHLQPELTQSTGITQPTTYGHLLHQMVLDTNQTQQVAGEKVRDVLRGGPTSVHEAMIAVEESSLSFQMLSEVRNKLLDSYHEIMRMQV